ncbi:MAG: nucleoside recognition domain-containing protein [Eubacteriales bacterium]|nr:nucleoside recognition domain-containing protein [Eubacteriales bacterium]
MFCILFFTGLISLLVTDGGDAAMTALFLGGGEAVSLCITLAGAYLLWMGVLGVAKAAGLHNSLSRLLARPVQKLLPGIPKEAVAPVTLNFATNMLGLGNAATPFGIAAMEAMQKTNSKPDTATNAMCCFLALNASALQVIPTTLLGLRASLGSAAPAAIFLPSLLSSGAATLAAALLGLWLCRKKERSR